MIYLLEYIIVCHGAIFVFHLLASAIESTIPKGTGVPPWMVRWCTCLLKCRKGRCTRFLCHSDSILLIGNIDRLGAILAFTTLQFYLCSEYNAVGHRVFVKYPEVNDAPHFVQLDIRIFLWLILSGIFFLFCYLLVRIPTPYETVPTNRDFFSRNTMIVQLICQRFVSVIIGIMTILE